MQKDTNIKEVNNRTPFPDNKNITTNPIDKTNLVAKINILGNGMNHGKVVHSLAHHSEKAYGTADYVEFYKNTNEIINTYKDLKDAQNLFHNLFVSKLNCAYTALGIINEQSNTINIKLLDKNSNVYSFKVFMSDSENEIVKSLTSGQISIHDNSSFLKISSLNNLPCVIIPVKLKGKNVCIALASDYNIHNHLNLYQMVASNLGLIVENSLLYDRVTQSSNMDSLTNLYSHRRFHELLSQELAYASSSKTKV